MCLAILKEDRSILRAGKALEQLGSEPRLAQAAAPQDLACRSEISNADHAVDAIVHTWPHDSRRLAVVAISVARIIL